MGWLRRIIMQPYNLACLLFCWTLCNLGMISPLLPVAVTAQIIMGTAFVYTIKMSTDLNLFYSMGDTAVFLKLQVYCSFFRTGGCSFFETRGQNILSLHLACSCKACVAICHQTLHVEDLAQAGNTRYISWTQVPVYRIFQCNGFFFSFAELCRSRSTFLTPPRC